MEAGGGTSAITAAIHGQESLHTKSRLDFWLPKLEANKLRDRQSIRRLTEMG